MSKMEQELERKLDENKYELLEIMRKVQCELRAQSGERRFFGDSSRDPLYTRVNRVLAKIKGGNSNEFQVQGR